MIPSYRRRQNGYGTGGICKMSETGNSRKKKRSLISSIMLLCGAVAAVTAIGIGGNSIFSIRSMSSSSYETYEEAVDEGYKAEIKSQV